MKHFSSPVGVHPDKDCKCGHNVKCGKVVGIQYYKWMIHKGMVGVRIEKKCIRGKIVLADIAYEQAGQRPDPTAKKEGYILRLQQQPGHQPIEYNIDVQHVKRQEDQDRFKRNDIPSALTAEHKRKYSGADQPKKHMSGHPVGPFSSEHYIVDKPDHILIYPFLCIYRSLGPVFNKRPKSPSNGRVLS